MYCSTSACSINICGTSEYKEFTNDDGKLYGSSSLLIAGVFGEYIFGLCNQLQLSYKNIMIVLEDM